MKLTVLSSGPHASATLDALISPLRVSDTPHGDVICITSTTHDVSIAGLRFCPDLDAAVAALTVDGRQVAEPSSTTVRNLLSQWGVGPHGSWPGLTDRAVAAALTRSVHAVRGLDPSESVADLLEHEEVLHPDVIVLPVTHDPIELHVIESIDGQQQGRHVERWLADDGRGTPVGFAVAGLDQASPAPGVLDAVRTSDVVVLVPMSPVLDSSGLLGVPGLRDALRGTAATVVVLSPVGLSSTRPAEADAAAWAQADLSATSPSVARLYADFADRLVIDDAEAPGEYPRAMNVVRAPLAQALAGDDGAREALRRAALTPPA